ncbi:hypothetical protein FDP41_004909 [Naegleria fowleri]|uniref:Uncharacterized protein n=1 Tax=Naegleria fowleri TaxID=5763 RepID=A0A6A5BQ31_NAEFO|nr:uncharacterized protein FDP41_004909 [Naegleria fowleri]KAF0976234.1 hypothetical protein FDP41_004909 [Naegleria fowleri]
MSQKAFSPNSIQSKMENYLGRNYFISRNVVKMEKSFTGAGTDEPSTMSEPSSSSWTISEIYWDQLPKFKKKQKLEYGSLLNDYCEWVKELEMKCSLEHKISNSHFEEQLRGLENQFLKLETKTKQFFTTHSIYRGGDIEKQFYNLLDIVQKLLKITCLFIEERFGGDLLLSKVNQSVMNHAQSFTTENNSERGLSTHLQLIEQILQEHVARVMSRIDQFEQVKKLEFDSSVVVLQRVEKYSL